MSRIIVAIFCILLILGGGLFNLYYVDNICGDMLGSLDTTLSALEKSGRDDGQALEAAFGIWEDNHPYLCTFIAHDQIDQVTNAFERAEAFLQFETYDEYYAEVLQLRALIHMVRTFDRPSIRSIL